MASHFKRKTAAFTLVELIVAAGVFSIFAAAIMTSWAALGTSALNTTTFAQRQSEQMRVLDYLKRDIRRSSSVAIYNGATLVSGTNNYGGKLQLTMQHYYADTRQEDDYLGSRTANTPTLSGSNVVYGTPFTVQYYVSNGAILRNEAGTIKTICSAAGGFTLSFCNDTTGLIRCRVGYSQTLRSGGNRTLARTVDILCGQRSQL